jgi:hypothetical protein
MSKTTYNQQGMPAQKLSSSQKGEEWGKQCVKAILSMSSSTSNNGRTSKQTKQANYDLYNSKYDEEDFQYVLDPYGVAGKWGDSPVKMQNYNIIRPKIELLKGEEIKRPFNFFAKGVGGEVLTLKQQKKRELIMNMLTSMVQQELGEQVDDEGNPITPEQIQKYMDAEYLDIREVTANQVLQYLTRKEEIEMKFNQGWEHALIAAEEIYHVGIVSGEPTVRVVNPLNFDYDKDDDLKFIDDAQWCKEERWLTPGSILDLYGDYLSEADVERLDSGQIGGGMVNHGMQHSFVYNPDSFSNTQRPQNGIYVANVCWKSMKKLGFLTYIDPKTLEEVETVVDDTFVLTKELRAMGASVTWRWISEVWEGVQIGDDIYPYVRPLENQTRSMYNPSECKMPYTGYVYNNTNSQATSLVDLCKAHQYTYMIVWWRLEGELAKAKGKKFIFDISQMPKSEGWTMDQWMYYFENLGIAVINPLEEGKTSKGNERSGFNGYTSIDLSLSQAVEQYISILNKLEGQVSSITGVSPQREGQTYASETAAGVERATTSSSHITEPYFYYHNIVKKQVLTKLLETAKVAYAGGTNINYIVDEVYTAMINVDEEQFPDSDYGVFVSNSSKDHMIKEKIEALAQVALQQDKVFLSDIITIYKSNSISEMESKIVKGEQDKMQREQEAGQANNEAAAQQQEKLQAWEREKMANENEQNELDRQNKIQTATLASMKGKDGPGDMNMNGVPDPIEQARLYMDKSMNDAKMAEGQGKLALQAAKQAKDYEQSEKKMWLDEQKLQHDKEKLSQEAAMFKREQDQQDRQSARDEKMQVKEHKMKMDEMKAKTALEKYKIKNKPKPTSKKK